MLDLDGAAALDLDGEGALTLALPFGFTWFGETQEEVRVGADGVLLFGEEGDPADPSCPGTGGDWSGVAALWGDLGSGEVRTQTFGRYPYRAFAVEWTAPDAVAGGEGRAQAWLLEGRDEAVIVLDDLLFSDEGVDSSADGGAAAVIGVQGGGEALVWSCAGGLSDERSAWYGPATARPAAPERASSSLDAWTGFENFQYVGRTLAAADLQGDGDTDLVLGDQDEDAVYVVLGGPDASDGSLADADTVLLGEGGEDLGSAIALGDLDGDGALEIALGAPASDRAGSASGMVVVVSGSALPATLSLPEDADLVFTGPTTGRASAGTAVVAADLDGDGYADLAVGAPRADLSATDAGAVYLWPGGADVLGATHALSSVSAVLEGAASGDQAGRVLAAADLDGDGAAELFVAAPYADASATDTNAGRVYGIAGASLADGALASVSLFSVLGGAGDDRLGLAMGAGDLDGDGLGELALGAPYADGGASSSGAVYVFYAAGALSGELAADEADATILGTEVSANLGGALTLADLDGDSLDDLVLAAPNATGETADSGVVGVFTSISAGDYTLDDAQHRVLGSDSAGAVGTAVAVAEDHDGDGFADLVLGAPFANPGGYSRAGSVYLWSFVQSFLDDDHDGFVSTAAGGIDCDDASEGVYPGGAEVGDDLIDNDCDGWVDGVVLPRLSEDWWRWDLAEELGGPEPVRFDFEDARAGEDVDDLYLDDNLALRADGSVGAAALVWECLPSGALGATVVPGSDGNSLTLYFGDGVEALGFRVLDGSAPFLLSALVDDEPLVSELPFEVNGESRTGGVFAGFIFSDEITQVTLDAAEGDAWGIDDIDIVWAADTDGDLDGYTDNGGDCDDEDPARSPGLDERLGNGVDDDCDGVIDGGGAEVYADAALWEIDAAFSPTVVDFEDLASGEAVALQYLDLGLEFEGDLEASDDIDGSAPRGALGGALGEGALRIEFDETQPAVGMWILDASGEILVLGEADGEPLYELSLDPGGEDLEGGVFVGLLLDYGVDALEIYAEGAFDVIGLDDLALSPLGLDDADGDGFTEAEGDCDDHESGAVPGGEEVYYDGVDGDCDGASDYDADGDGYDIGSAGGPDCDDGSDAVSPDAEEVYYDGVDADCDGGSDYDADGDGHDDAAWGGEDCDDGDGAVSPDAEEVYYDGVDADCGGDSDYDADGDGFVPSMYGGFIGEDGTVSVGDCDDAEEIVFPGAEDAAYDGVDSDCVGDSDYDADDDGHDAIAWGGDDCNDGDAAAYPGAPLDRCYDGEDGDCAGDSDWDCDRDGYELDSHGGEDCDDRDPAIYPGAADLPRDGVDGDCDGALEFDDDGDGWDGEEDGGADCDDADPAVHPEVEDTCYDGLDADCDDTSDDDCDKDGYDAADRGGADCEDADGSIHPGAVDYYYDGIDNDCDGEEDFDQDGDGWPADWYGGEDCDDTVASTYPGATEVWYDGVDADCAEDDDYDQDGDGARASLIGGADCDDEDASVGPSETEIALDGTDQDCDGIDDVDLDEDGWYSADDCDDEDALVAPGAAEVCYDARDQDCDGADTVDCDGDGVDAASAGGLDCDDADAAVLPGAAEIWYDGVDGDCAGDDDYDQDGDGHRIDTLGGEDCDDTDAGVNPAHLLDECGAGDEDCDGFADEDCSGEGEQEPAEDGEERDSGEPGQDTADTGGAETGGQETGEDVLDGPERQAPSPEIVAQGCRCASAPDGAGLGGVGLGWLLGLLALIRRQR